MPFPHALRSRLSHAAQAAGLAACALLSGCVGLPMARTPAAALLTPMSTAIGMGLGADMAFRTMQVGSIERAADITPEEQAHFESLDCAGLRAMAANYTPSGANAPAANSYAMRAVGSRLELLARLQAAKVC